LIGDLATGSNALVTLEKRINIVVTAAGQDVKPHPYYDNSCIVIGCNFLRPHRKMNMFILGRSCITVAVTVVNTKLHGCSRIAVTVVVVLVVQSFLNCSTFVKK